MPAEPETFFRLLASVVVRIPFFTRSSTRVGLTAPPTLAPLVLGADAAAALVGAAAAALESAAVRIAGIKRHATAIRVIADDRKYSRIFASKVGTFLCSGGKALVSPGFLTHKSHLVNGLQATLMESWRS